MGKKIKRDPRHIRIDIDPENANLYSGVALDFKNQAILGVEEARMKPLVGETHLKFSRARKNKSEKILYSGASNGAWFNSNQQILSYDHLVAVDTNTNWLNGSSVSVTAAFHLIPISPRLRELYCHARVLMLSELWNVSVKPENLGWWQVLNAIQLYQHEFQGKIGLIVDSDLGSHPEFNVRRKPIVGEYYLPDNVTMIYASDKGGPEHLSTKMIRYCHNLASDLYRNNQLLLNPKGIERGVDGIYSHIRQWDTDEMDLRPFEI